MDRFRVLHRAPRSRPQIQSPPRQASVPWPRCPHRIARPKPGTEQAGSQAGRPVRDQQAASAGFLSRRFREDALCARPFLLPRRIGPSSSQSRLWTFLRFHLIHFRSLVGQNDNCRSHRSRLGKTSFSAEALSSLPESSITRSVPPSRMRSHAGLTTRETVIAVLTAILRLPAEDISESATEQCHFFPTIADDLGARTPSDGPAPANLKSRPDGGPGTFPVQSCSVLARPQSCCHRLLFHAVRPDRRHPDRYSPRSCPSKSSSSARTCARSDKSNLRSMLMKFRRAWSRPLSQACTKPATRFASS